MLPVSMALVKIKYKGETKMKHFNLVGIATF